MTHTRRLICKLATLTLIVGFASPLSAQVDADLPRPNVLLLVDTSGSMEYTSANAEVTCAPTATTGTKSRWMQLVEVLTGGSYRCQSVARNTSAFKTQYAIPDESSAAPADYLYTIPYHRPVIPNSTTTTTAYSYLAPGSTNASLQYCTYTTSSASTSCCTYGDSACTTPLTGYSGGILDAYKEEVRFGLMTFDTLPSSSKLVAGHWTYAYGTTPTGYPANCSKTDNTYDVGARNAAAPLWEGRLVAFGPPQSSTETSEIATRNELIQRVLLATRPFGATPIAGMLKDAQDFFWNDTSPDGSTDTPPKSDPYVTGGCRSNIIILLTDGEPNLDLRDACAATGGVCPYSKPSTLAAALAAGSGGAAVKVYVLGFSVNTDVSGTTDCSDLTTSDLTSTTGICATARATAASNYSARNRALLACCNLNEIAYNGGTTHAYFADNETQLRSALATILDAAVKGATSRTYPVFASATGSYSTASSFRFFTSFTSRIYGNGLWPGVIERQRYVCNSSGVAEIQAVTKSKGDDFAYNVNANTSPARVFYTVEGDSTSGSVYSTRTIRPNIASSNTDGVGSYTGTLKTGSSTTLPTTVSSLAQDLATSAPSCMAETSATASTCSQRYLKWLLGEADGSTDNYDRCVTAGASDCNLIADVYHSVPALVNRPSENLRDESYQRFALSEQRTRPLVLYTSTNDGLLHAFRVTTNDPSEQSDSAKTVETSTNNEIWAFIPPAVLPRIWSEYPNVHQRLLDGAPITKDIPATEKTVSSVKTIQFQRNLGGEASGNFVWHTALVQSFGSSYPGYFGLDITSPEPADGGPRFLWQLTTDSSGNNIFGTAGGTPAITTLFFDPDGGSNPREITVALLPGGDGGATPSPSTSCARDKTPSTSDYTSGLVPRTNVPCYDDTGGSRVAARLGRSVTVVRLDTGEIIRTFRRTADAPSGIASGRVIDTDLDSPITGQPVAYPGWTGAIADRAYVGDKDGSLWRLDFSSTNPSNWTMKLFFDAYYMDTSSASTGQPISTPPIISTNDSGEVVVAFSTGSQEDLTGTSGKTFVYSLVEKSTTSTSGVVFKAEINWYYQFTDGERVTGPMTLFADGLYFSTYKPPASSSACSYGTSRIGGMHYETVSTTADMSVSSDALSRGGKAWLPKGGISTATEMVQFYKDTDSVFPSGSTIFGVGVAQVPSCFTSGTVTTDPFFGSTTSTTTTSSATYQLVMQTGVKGTAISGGTTKAQTVDLPPADVSPRINSWALVME